MTGQRFRVSHQTTYDYSVPMSDGYTLAVVTPRATPWQRVDATTITVDPEPDERVERNDVFGNRVVQLGIHHQHDRLSVRADSDVTVSPIELDGAGPPCDAVAASVAGLRGSEALDIRQFAGGVPLVSADADRASVEALVAPALTPGRPIVEAARALCRSIHEQFEYDHAFTEVSTPLTTVLDAKRGVCQDFAHLAIAALRTFGLPARYVSGYIEAATPLMEHSEPTQASERQRASGQTRPAWPGNAMNASHAWCAVWAGDGLGWIDFDPTNGHLPIDSHITVAWGRDYGDVAPVRGVVIGPPASQQLSVGVEVTRL
jgi:transglutaminase-like putative cysteine protease